MLTCRNCHLMYQMCIKMQVKGSQMWAFIVTTMKPAKQLHAQMPLLEGLF